MNEAKINIEVIDKEAEMAIAVKYDGIDFTNMGGIMGEGYQKLWSYLGQCGKEIAGAPYCKYTNGSADFMKFDIELGVPVSEAVPEADGIYMSTTCAGKAIAAMHKGAYKDIEVTYGPMMQYLAENGLQSTGVYYDYYLNDPAGTAEEDLLTRVVFPLK
ncbi:MAG: GyrI-like domain-containing protein [Lachnospiraceae bacterium]|jgi:effector-binding domain-containing protein|nr:GyrI-like domain-containing protein [Lachnospiraceae bacterium]